MATSPDQKFKIEVHPAAAIFPMLSDDELGDMAKSIAVHGLREKIQATPIVSDDRTDWLVIDGRNRLEALRRMGVKDEQIIAEYVEPINLAHVNATPEEYVVMANIERRNLTQPQRKELAGKLALMLAESQKDKPKEERSDTLAQAAKAAGVSRRTAASGKQQVAAGETIARKKPTPAKKKGGAVVPTPGTILENVKKGEAAVKKYGHNWPKQMGVELFAACTDLLGAIASKKQFRDELESKLGPNWATIVVAAPDVAKEAKKAASK